MHKRKGMGTLAGLLGLLVVGVVLTGCCCCTSPGFTRFRPRPLFRWWERRSTQIPTLQVPVHLQTSYTARTAQTLRLLW